MDKILLNDKDIDYLNTWQIKNKHLVKKCPCPIRAIEISVKYEKHTLSFKCFRNGNIVNITSSLDLKFFGFIKMLIRTADGSASPIKCDFCTNINDEKKHNFIKYVCNLYFVIIAFISYGDNDQISEELVNKIDNLTKSITKIKDKKELKKLRNDFYSVGNTYILSENKNRFKLVLLES